LVVDDSEANRKLLVRILAPLGFQVREAADGREALDVWEAWSPHLIWMDMRMPVMDGYEATRRIKASTQGQATVVVALTASALEEDRQVILSEGCDDYVRKPFREEELFDALARHLGVRFVYQEESGDGDRDAPAARRDDGDRLPGLAQDLAALPPEWREALRAATVLGYEERIARLIEEVREEAPEVAQHLARLAERYDHEAILDLIQQAEGVR
jgi:CheY-like chemotaxis protein